ncbi:ATP-binding protein [Pseudonocardia sp.]|uniref:sensor histidine kinase n=1 Tax=Pseudonocardia sp. TaxID=60912 RepID=UPI0031FD7958
MAGPLLRRTLVRHVLLTAVVAVVVSGLLGVGVWRFAEDDAHRTAEKVARQLASAVLVPLSERDYERPGGFSRDELVADLAPFLGSGMVERVKVFSVSGDVARIVFSDEQRVEGRSGRLDPGLAARLDRGEVVVQQVPDDPEHAYERSLPGERFEVYFGFRDAGGNDTRLEVYVPVDVGATTGHAVTVLVPLVLSGLLLLALATVPLSISLARRMERDRAEQRAVRSYGLAAAELARRDLAQRLHDSVIPDLAGASLLMEAFRAEGHRSGDEIPWELLDHAHEVVADDVRRLRALLTELVGPGPIADDLAGALQDLVAQLRSGPGAEERGPRVSIEVEVDGLPEGTAVLVHRVAGELLRNAFRHAEAENVRVRVAGGPGETVELTVTDDGVGLDPGRRRRPGHIGLQLVEQVVGDGGGRTMLEGAPGAGTTVTVVLPRRLRAWAGEPAPAGAV